MSENQETDKKLFCSFCGKNQSEVKKLIAGPSVYICDECVSLCNDIIKEDLAEANQESSEEKLPVPEEIKAILDDYVIGQASSMGAILLTGGTKGKRFALPNSRIMIHQPLGGFQGQATDIEIHAQEILKIRTKLNEILSQHSGKDIDKVSQDTERDNFMSGDEAVKYGLIDKVIDKRDK